MSANLSHQASRLSIVGSFVRRQDDWTLQRNTSAQELSQLDAQLDGADLRATIAQAELDNQSTLVEQSKAVGDFLQEKHTTEELYDWMVGQLAGLYYQSYELAYKVAKQAEVAFRRDLGLRSSDWIKFGYWDSLKRGLLAGEALALDLKRMEAAYLEQNARDYEITKHVSLVSLDPNAFLDLKTTGTCQFELPEWLFDLDYPGHYLRRIRSASVTVPCVIGPYASVNCTVTLESSSVRIDADATSDYERDPRKPEDARFLDIRGASESIATSSAQADSGLFEANLRDERYLPFESHGAVSRWTIRLKSSDNGLALESATDFILHLRYTARDGGPDLEDGARNAIKKRIGAGDADTPLPDDQPPARVPHRLEQVPERRRSDRPARPLEPVPGAVRAPEDHRPQGPPVLRSHRRCDHAAHAGRTTSGAQIDLRDHGRGTDDRYDRPDRGNTRRRACCHPIRSRDQLASPPIDGI